MHVLHVPSWYPTTNYPQSGIFIKEQIEAIALFAPGTSHTVISWGHEETQFRIRDPIRFFINLLNSRPTRKLNKSFDNGITYYHTPSVWWSERLPMGGVSSIQASARKCFLRANAEHSVDIIHAHVGYPAGPIARNLAREANIPYVITEHMGLARVPSYMKKGQPIPEISEAYENASAIISVSNFLKQELSNLGLVVSHVIPNLVNEERFFPIKKNNSNFVFLLMGTLSHGKGIDLFLKAIDKVKNEGLQCEFWIAGTGPDEFKFQSLSENMGLASSVRWLGNISRDQVPQIFQMSDVFVLPSRYETFGVVYAEALACGKPVIATKCGGPDDIVTDGNGLLIDKNDPDQLANAMLELYHSYYSYSESTIRDSFMDRYSRSTVVSAISRVYQEVLGS